MEKLQQPLPQPEYAEQVVIVGDSPADVQAALEVGACSLAVATGTHSLQELAAQRPHWLFADLSDAARALRFPRSRWAGKHPGAQALDLLPCVIFSVMLALRDRIKLIEAPGRLRAEGSHEPEQTACPPAPLHPGG